MKKRLRKWSEYAFFTSILPRAYRDCRKESVDIIGNWSQFYCKTSNGTICIELLEAKQMSGLSTSSISRKKGGKFIYD